MAKDPKKTLEELNEELSHFEDQIISVADLLSQRVKDAIVDIREESANVAEIFEKKLKKSIRDISKETDTTLKNTLKLLDGSAKLEDIEKARLQLDLKRLATSRNLENSLKYVKETNEKLISKETDINKQVALRIKLTDEYDKLKTTSEAEIDDLYKQQTVHLNDQEVLAKKIQKNMGVTGAIMQGMTKIPILGNLINSQKVLAKIQQAAAKENATRMSTFGAGVKAVGSSVISNLTDPAVGFGLLAKIAQFFIDAMFDADKRVTDISKNLSISKDAARGLYDNLISSKSTLDTVYRTTKNIAEAFNDIAQITGFNTIATDKQIEAQITLTKQLGQSKEEALSLQETFALNNIEADKAIHTTYNQIAAFANQNKITADGRKIFNEISKTSKIIQLNFRGNYKELVNTVLETKKLGLSLEQVSKIGKSLLNFEQSIASEIEAELITGRELNLEEARRYALNHDLAGLTKEIAKNGVDATKFAAMNTIQQESIANAIGMSADELADILYKQELINKLSKGETEEMRKQAAIARSIGNEKEAQVLEARAAAMEAGLLRGEQLEDAQKQVDAQEKFNLAIERIKELFSDLVHGGLVEKLINYLDKFVGSLESGKSLASILLFGPSSNPEVTNANYIQSLPTNSSERRRAENDAARIFTPIEQGEKMASGGIVTRRKDNVTIGEAGPEAVIPLNAFYAKFDELIAAVNKGGNVYLDREKVGTSFAVGTREI